MGLAMLANTHDDIQNAYDANDILKIAKETQYVFDRIVHFLLSTSRNRLKGITFESNEFKFNKTYLLSINNKKHMIKMLRLLQNMQIPLTDLDFGKIKVDLELWHYRMGGDGIYFEYQDEYLITPKEAAKSLGISHVTLNKYMKQGLESIDTTSHHKIPKHAVELWIDPVYAIRIQLLAQERKIQMQTPEERLKEVQAEILELQKEFKVKSSNEAINKLNVSHLDALDDPSILRHWQDLEEEQDDLLKELIGGS